MTRTQADDAKEKAKTQGDGAQRAVRSAWSHILYPVKSEMPGKPFDLEHSLISARDRTAIPSVVYDKARADGLALEKLGTERLWLALKPIWPADRAHLTVAEVVDWFAAYVYLPKLRDRVVLEASIRDAVGKLDPQFGYADGFDDTTGRYRNLIWAKNPPELTPASALLVRATETAAQVAADAATKPVGPGLGPMPGEPPTTTPPRP